MFISRQLRIALLISFFWHLFLMASVSIVFLPKGLQPKQYTSVDFFGSILRSAFEQGGLARAPLREFPSEIDTEGQSFFYGRPGGSLLSEKEPFNPEDFIDIDVSKKSATLLASSVSREMSLQREVIFRPPIPQYPEWADSQEFMGGCVIFRIYISSQGLVQVATNIQGSGNPEIDASLARYVRKLRFAPVAGQKGAWQTVKLSLDLE